MTNTRLQVEYKLNPQVNYYIHRVARSSIQTHC